MEAVVERAKLLISRTSTMNTYSRRDDELARIEDLKINILEVLEDLWENNETTQDLFYEIKADFRQLLKLQSELK